MSIPSRERAFYPTVKTITELHQNCQEEMECSGSLNPNHTRKSCFGSQFYERELGRSTVLGSTLSL